MNVYKSIFILSALFTATTAYSQPLLQDKKDIKADLGFGIEQKLQSTSAAVSVITHEELKQTAAINLSEALYGRLLGLTVLKNGGFSGDDNYGPSLNIRGFQTLSENGLLIMVDGVKRPIDRLTVDEVESVTVLKDAAAVALLGYQGINGALLIKTKRGGEGSLNIDVSYDHKFTFDPKIADFVDAETYGRAINEARSNDGLTALYKESELALFKSGEDPFFYPNVNWKKEALKNSSSEDRLNMSIHGSSDKLKYFTMLNYTSSNGLLKGTDQPDFNSQLKYSKANIRANIDFAVTPTTNMTVNALASFIETNEPASGNANDIMYQIYRLPASAFPIRTINGIWGGNQDYTDANPIARIQDTGKEKTHHRALYADAKLTQRLDFLTEGLSASVRMAYDNYSRINEEHYKSFQYGYTTYAGAIGDKDNINTITYGDKINSLNYNKWLGNQWRASQFSLSIDYQKAIEDHDITSSLIYNTTSENGMGRYNTFYRANVMWYLHYGWRQKVIADLVLAANGSNRSYPEKWSFSPTFSMAYIFANNPDNPVLNFGKVRASAGIHHSDYVPVRGLWLENYGGGHGNIVFKPSYDGNNWGTALTHYPLTSFALETAYKANLGVDLRLFNALDITADAYYNRRSNIMQKANDLNSWVVGRPDSYATQGKVDSYGVELGLNYAKRFNKDFMLHGAASFTWGTNEIVDYIEIPTEAYQSHIGQRIDQSKGLVAIGFFKDEEDIANSPQQQFSQVKPGDIKYKDQNHDNVINEDDEVFYGYGSSIPETNFAFSLGAEYKQVGFNVLFQGATGLTKYLNTVGVWNCVKGNNNLSTHYLENAWRPNSDNSKAIYPRLTTQDSQNNYRGNTIWHKNIEWLKLRNIELYYKLPQSWLTKVHIAEAKIYMQGENLLTFSNMDVMDPEVLGTSYPLMKGINLGVLFKF